MLLIINLLGAFFILIAFLITEKNAPYLLAGYNTLSKAEQAKFDLTTYLREFRKFHIFLGVSTALIGSILYLWVSETWAGLFMAGYPILAYIYFIWTNRKTTIIGDKKASIAGIIVLILTLFFVLGLFYVGQKEATISLRQNTVKISGTYGETLQKEDIETVTLTQNLPKITFKSNGFAVGAIKKGYFKTDGGETVKLILNSNQKPYLHIRKKDQKSIYFAPKNQPIEPIFEALQQLLE